MIKNYVNIIPQIIMESLKIDYSDIYIYSDQPTTCPKCSSSTEIVFDLSHTNNMTQIHFCHYYNCKFQFIMQYDEDFENGALD